MAFVLPSLDSHEFLIIFTGVSPDLEECGRP